MFGLTFNHAEDWAFTFVVTAYMLWSMFRLARIETRSRRQDQAIRALQKTVDELQDPWRAGRPKHRRSRPDEPTNCQFTADPTNNGVTRRQWKPTRRQHDHQTPVNQQDTDDQ